LQGKPRKAHETLDLHYPELHLRGETVSLLPWDAQVDVGLVQTASRERFIADMVGLPWRCNELAAAYWIERRLARREGCSLVIFDKDHGGRVGEVALSGQADGVSANLYYWVLGGYRGRGLATEACRLLCNWALTQPPLAAVTAFVSQRNAASIRVLEKLGFLRGGRVADYAGYSDRLDTYGYYLFSGT